MGFEEVIKNISKDSTDLGKQIEKNDGMLQESINKSLLPELDGAELHRGEVVFPKNVEELTPNDFDIKSSDIYPGKKPWVTDWKLPNYFVESKELSNDELNELQDQYNEEVANNSAAGQVNETRITDWEKIPSEELAEKKG
jgi:hypothetical protein